MRLRKLMIVDDSNIIRSKIARSLGNFGLEIVGLAANGRDALALFQKERPDLVTMDLTMPEMDGLACIRALRAMDAKVRILVVSALSDKSDAIAALKVGAQGFLCKPFTEDDLMEAMVELIEED